MGISNADRAELRALVENYAIVADNGDTDRFAALFTQDAVIVSPAATMTGLELISKVPGMLAQMYPRTMHIVVSHDVLSVEGDMATGETRSFAHHIERAADGSHSIDKWMIRYQDRYARQGDAWKIAHRHLIVDWTERVPITAGPGIPAV